MAEWNLRLPPSTNRGVTLSPGTSPKPISSAALSYITKDKKNEKIISVNDFGIPKFDWFEGRFRFETDIDNVLSKIMPFLSPQISEFWTSHTDLKLSPIQRGYGYSMSFYNADFDCILSLHSSGQNGKYGVYFKTTGSFSPIVVNLLATAYGITYEAVNSLKTPILCTRVDVAIDFRMDNAKAFRRLQKTANSLKLTMDCAGSWLTKNPVPTDAGRTLYIKESTTTKIRLYEKSKEQIFKHGLEPGSLPGDWLRFEVQFRSPDGTQANLWKAVFANLKPDALLGMSEEITKMVNDLLGIGITYEKIQTTVKKQPLGIAAFLDYLIKTFEEKLKFILGGNLGYELAYRLFGDNFNEYPPLLQSKAMEQFLIELEFNQFGEF